MQCRQSGDSGLKGAVVSAGGKLGGKELEATAPQSVQCCQRAYMYKECLACSLLLSPPSSGALHALYFSQDG